MKPPILPLLFSALGLALCASSSLAQSLSTPVTANFFIPNMVDPDYVTFTSTGQTFTTTQQGNVINGQRLYQPSFSFNGGLNFYAAVPNPLGPSAPTIPIVEVDFFTPYTGPISLVSSAGFSGFDPWFAETLSVPVGQGFRFYKTLPTQADINTVANSNNFINFAYFNLTPNDPNDPTFLAAPFTITGFTSVQNVPEPGTIALLGALAVSGGVAWRRRRKLS